MTKLKVTKVALKDWKKKYFGHVQTLIKEIRNVIEALQNLPQSDRILDQEKATYKELDELLQREQILLKDKAKKCWLTDGDANTRYFHLSTIAHQRQNHIDHIFTEIGQRKTG